MKRVRIFSFIIAVLLLLLTLPLNSFAADTVVTMVNSSVESDLKHYGIDFSQYPKETSNKEDFRLIHMQEYGYDFNADFKDYGLYLYFYNPSGRELLKSELTKIQLAVYSATGERVNIGSLKYSLEILSHSTSTGYEHVFYKVRVKDANSFVAALSRTRRHYEISSVEVMFNGNNRVENFTIADTYIYTGFQAYKNKNRTIVDTLYCTVKDIHTAEIEVHPATWFTKSSDKGEDYLYEVFSVYFAVPNWVIRQYGDFTDEYSGLREIRGEYQEKIVNGLVTDNNTVYEIFDDIVGKNIMYNFGSSYSDPYNYNSFWNNGFFVNCIFENPVEFEYGVSLKYSFGKSFNIKTFDDLYFTTGEEVRNTLGALVPVKTRSDECLKIIASLFNDDNVSYKDFLDYYLTNGRVAKQSNAVNQYEVTTSDGALNKVFEMGTYADGKSELTKFQTWVDKYFKGNKHLYEDEGIAEDIMPVIKIDKNLIIGDAGVVWKDDYAADKLFMTQECYQEFKAFVSENALKDNTIYVMRFAVRDYFAAEAIPCDNLGNPILSANLDHNTYYFERSLFDNFDVCEFEYEDEIGKRSVVPVSAKPITVTGGVVAPDVEDPNDPEGDGDSFDIRTGCQALSEDLGHLKVGIVLLLFVGAFAFALWLLGLIGITPIKVFRGIGWLIALPFRLIGRLFGFVERRHDKRIENEAKRAQIEGVREQNASKRFDNSVASERFELEKRKSASDMRRADSDYQAAQDKHYREEVYQRSEARKEEAYQKQLKERKAREKAERKAEKERQKALANISENNKK